MKSYKTEQAAKGIATKLTKKLGLQHAVKEVSGAWCVYEVVVEKQATRKVTIKSLEAQNVPVLEAVKEYAVANSEYGWKELLDSWTDEAIIAALGRTKSIRNAILRMYHLVVLKDISVTA